MLSQAEMASHQNEGAEFPTGTWCTKKAGMFGEVQVGVLRHRIKHLSGIHNTDATILHMFRASRDERVFHEQPGPYMNRLGDS